MKLNLNTFAMLQFSSNQYINILINKGIIEDALS